VVAELLTRVSWKPATPIVRSKPPNPEGLPELVTPFELAEPNKRAIHDGKFWRTNSAGFRGPEVAEFPAPGTFRIVVAGDSITMGSGVLEEEAYVAVLESMLNAEAGGVHYEVLNLGLAGLNIEVVVNRLRDVGLRFHPDLVVYGFTLNDIEGPAYRSFTNGPYRAWHRRMAAAFDNSPFYLLRTVWPRWVSLRDVLAPPPGSYEYELDYNYFHNPAAWQDFLTQMDRLAAIGRDHGICVNVLIHTTPHYLNFLHPFRRIYERVANAAVERGMTVSQSFPVFRGHDGSSLALSAVDAHPNPAGHRLLAQALREGLRRLPAQCWARHETRAMVQPPD